MPKENIQGGGEDKAILSSASAYHSIEDTTGGLSTSDSYIAWTREEEKAKPRKKKAVSLDEEPESCGEVVKTTTVQALKMTLSFTFSAQLPLLLAMTGHLQDSNGDNTLYLAAATLGVLIFETGAVASVTPSFAIMFEGGPLYGQILDLKTPEDQKTALKKEISRMIKNAVLLCTPVALPVTAFLFFSKSILVNLFKQDEAVSELVQQFSRPMATMIPVYVLRFAQQNIFFTHQQVGWVTVISLTSFLLCSVFLAEGLGFGRFSLPNLGMWGIVAATMAENILTTLGMSVGLLFKDAFKDYHFSASFLRCDAQDGKQQKALAKQGIPLDLTYLSEQATAYAKGMLYGYVGKTALAAQNFAGLLSFSILILAHAFSQAVALNIATASKARRVNRARYGLLTSLLASLLLAVPASIRPEIVIGIVGGDVSGDVASLAPALIRLAAGTSVLYMPALTMLQSLRMTPNHLKPTFVFNAWLWVSVLTAYLLGFQAEWGAVGIGLGSLLGTGAGTLHLSTLWYREFISEKKEDDQPSPAELEAPFIPPSSSEAEMPRVSSSWCSCFSRIMNRYWYQVPAVPDELRLSRAEL